MRFFGAKHGACLIFFRACLSFLCFFNALSCFLIYCLLLLSYSKSPLLKTKKY